jgi:hypothetical protein
MGACSSAARPDNANIDGLTYEKQHNGQLAPPQPTAAEVREGETPSGPVLVMGNTLMQRGAFGSLWVRSLRHAGLRGGMSSLLLAAEAAEASLGRTNKKEYGSTVYVCVSEKAAAVRAPSMAASR